MWDFDLLQKKRPDSLESGLKEGAVKIETAKPMVLPPRTLVGFRYTPKKRPDSLESGLKEGSVKIETAKPIVLTPHPLVGFRFVPKKKTQFVRIES